MRNASLSDGSCVNFGIDWGQIGWTSRNSGPNDSGSSCVDRQRDHGAVGRRRVDRHRQGGELAQPLAAAATRRARPFAPVTVTTSTIWRSPPNTIAAIAPASAQLPSGYAAFSTLHPAKIVPTQCGPQRRPGTPSTASTRRHRRHRRLVQLLRRCRQLAQIIHRCMLPPPPAPTPGSVPKLPVSVAENATSSRNFGKRAAAGF